MKYINLRVVDTNNNKQEKFVKISVIISFLILFTGYILSYFLSFNSIYISVLFFISFLNIFFIKWKYKRYKIIGKISLSPKMITLKTTNSSFKLPINNNTKLYFYFRGIKGDMFDPSLSGYNLFDYKDGADNFLEYSNNDKTLLINILLENAYQLKGIKIIFSEIRKNEINCKIENKDYKLTNNLIDTISAFEWKVKHLKH